VVHYSLEQLQAPKQHLLILQLQLLLLKYARWCRMFIRW